MGECRIYARKTTGEDGSKEQRPPVRVAVFTIYYETVCSACMPIHRITLCIGDRGSSNDITSIVGGALERTFQPLRNQIDHHIPSCTAVVWEEERSPNHKAAKAFIHRCTSVAPVPEAWQEHHSLQHMETCEREHAYGNLRSLLITFTILPAFLP